MLNLAQFPARPWLMTGYVGVKTLIIAPQTVSLVDNFLLYYMSVLLTYSLRTSTLSTSISQMRSSRAEAGLSHAT